MNSLKGKDKVLKYERKYENLIELSFSRREEGDYIGALSILKNMLTKDCNADVYAHIADIYTDMGLYEQAVNCWYKFLSKSKKKYYTDAYNGLGANFFLSENDDVAGYYFNKQLQSEPPEGSVYEDVLEDYLDSVIENKNGAYRVVYPVSEEKEAENKYEKGRELLRNKKYEEALKVLSEIEETDKIYLKAEVEKAYSYFYLNQPETSLSIISDAIDKGELSVYSLTLAINASAVIASQDLLGKYLDMLIEYKSEDEDEKYKKLSLLLTLNLVDMALEYSEEAMKSPKYLPGVYFIRGVIFYNRKDYFRAEESLRYSYILGDNPITKFYLDLAESALIKKPVYRKLEYGFELPEKEVIRRIELVKKLFYNFTSGKEVDFPDDFVNVAKWVLFDGNKTLQSALAVIISSDKLGRYVDLLKDALISTYVSDEVKQRIITSLTEFGYSGDINVVYGYIYRKIRIPKIELENLHGVLQKAYCYAVGRLSLIEDGIIRLKTSTLAIQKKIKEKNSDFKPKEVSELACIIYLQSSLVTFRNAEAVYSFFGSSKAKVNKIYFELFEKDVKTREKQWEDI